MAVLLVGLVQLLHHVRGHDPPGTVDGVVTLGRPVTCARAWH
jgi:hypothetical protein